MKLWCNNHLWIIILELVFTTKKWETAVVGNPNLVLNVKFVNLDSSVTISCDTNDTTATVTLSQRDSTSDPYKNVMEKYKNSITKVGQTFVIGLTGSQHSGYYQCTARSEKDSEIELELGRLIVSQSKYICIMFFNYSLLSYIHMHIFFFIKLP